MSTEPFDSQRASDFIRKMVEGGMEEQALKLEQKLRLDNPSLKFTPFNTEKILKEFITSDPDMLKLKDKVRILANENYPVLIIGETGTGKEILARALHGARSGAMESINCAAIPDQLLESILFGHRKGSFTDANEDRIGLMQSCNRGTLHLDEIGEMPMLMQGKLLRALQERKIRRIGENKEIEIDCRIVASTNKNIENSSLFREDLYWRLCVFVLKITPLRLRPSDVNLFLKLQHPDIVDVISMYCRDQEYNYLKGNYRELQAIITRYKVLGEI